MPEWLITLLEFPAVGCGMFFLMFIACTMALVSFTWRFIKGVEHILVPTDGDNDD